MMFASASNSVSRQAMEFFDNFIHDPPFKPQFRQMGPDGPRLESVTYVFSMGPKGSNPTRASTFILWIIKMSNKNAMFTGRRCAALLCLALLLFASLAQAPTGIFFALLLPVWFFVAAIVAVLIPVVEEPCEEQRFSALAVFSPRPPPAQ
jgi:hypothetical protein